MSWWRRYLRWCNGGIEPPTFEQMRELAARWDEMQRAYPGVRARKWVVFTDDELAGLMDAMWRLQPVRAGRLDTHPIKVLDHIEAEIIAEVERRGVRRETAAVSA